MTIELTPAQAFAQAVEAQQGGNAAYAEALYRALLEVPGLRADSAHNLAVLLVDNRPKEAVGLFEQALAARPEQTLFWVNYIKAMIARRRFGTAAVLLAQYRSALPQDVAEQLLQSLRQAARQVSEHPAPWDVEDFMAFYRNGDFPGVIRFARALVDVFPHSYHCWDNLGSALCEGGEYREAVDVLQHSLSLYPDNANTLNNLGVALKSLGMLREAVQCYRKTIMLNPKHENAYNNLGNVYKDWGDLAQAEQFYRRAIEINPAFFTAYSNLLFSSNYLAAQPVEESLREAQAFGRVASAAAETRYTRWQQDDSQGKLRIGFVSADLRNHPVGYFLESLVSRLDPQVFELYAFPCDPREDELSARLRPFFTGWQTLQGKSNPEAAALIHGCGIHILIDLSGHSGYNRLPVFAYRPAPVQASWLGYFATTGLPEMDYFIGDPYLAAEGTSGFSEQLFALPESWFCFTPPENAPDVSPLPALSAGHITFGSFGNFAKMNDRVISVWSAVLNRLPDARLFLKNSRMGDEAICNEVRRKFAAFGIAAERLHLEGSSPRHAYWSAYHQVDMMLDTFPYPGGTTSCEALWMGVPVLTLSGNRFLSRLGVSVAHNAGLPDWVADSTEDYVHKAVRFARNPEYLSALRQKLRHHLPHTPLFDAQRFAHGFAGALRQMYRDTLPKRMSDQAV